MPAAHDVDVDELPLVTGLHIVAPKSDTVLAAHCVQYDAPLTGLKEFGMQLLQ